MHISLKHAWTVRNFVRTGGLDEHRNRLLTMCWELSVQEMVAIFAGVQSSERPPHHIPEEQGCCV